MQSTLRVRFAAILVGTGLAAALPGQCTNPWLVGPLGGATLGVAGTVEASTLWDPDGPGPSTPVVVFGGQFTIPGTTISVLVAPDILGLLSTTNGTVVSELPLPSAPPLVGVTFYHQLVPIEIGAGGIATAVSATNALRLLVGQF